MICAVLGGVALYLVQNWVSVSCDWPVIPQTLDSAVPWVRASLTLHQVLMSTFNSYALNMGARTALIY